MEGRSNTVGERGGGLGILLETWGGWKNTAGDRGRDSMEILLVWNQYFVPENGCSVALFVNYSEISVRILQRSEYMVFLTK